MELPEFSVQSSCTHHERKVWLHKGPSQRSHPLCIILDGEFYLERLNATSLLTSAMNKSLLPEMSLLFVSWKSAEARQTDYLCKADFSAFIAKDLVFWAKQQVPSIRESHHLLCGVSLSGLLSTFIALNYPLLFPYCLSQSGSFWWEHEWFGEKVRELSPVTGRFWLSVGDKETDENVSHPPFLYQKASQIFGVTNAVTLLKEAGAEVRFHMYEGGHEPGPWKEELLDALRWLASFDATPYPTNQRRT
jgi:enterochelin esterase family protein